MTLAECIQCFIAAVHVTSLTDHKLFDLHRNNVSHFDYFHEDSTGSDLTLHKKQKKLPPGMRNISTCSCHLIFVVLAIHHIYQI